MASKLIVDTIVGRDEDGNDTQVLVSTGITVTGVAFSVLGDFNISGVITASQINTTSGSGLTIVGIVTANNFAGDGTNLTNLSIASGAQALGYIALY
jgi:hypothetical protein